MPFRLKSGRAFWTWHSPVKRSFVAGKKFLIFFFHGNKMGMKFWETLSGMLAFLSYLVLSGNTKVGEILCYSRGSKL